MLLPWVESFLWVLLWLALDGWRWKRSSQASQKARPLQDEHRTDDVMAHRLQSLGESETKGELLYREETSVSIGGGCIRSPSFSSANSTCRSGLGGGEGFSGFSSEAAGGST